MNSLLRAVPEREAVTYYTVSSSHERVTAYGAHRQGAFMFMNDTDTSIESGALWALKPAPVAKAGPR
jgi:hypothetical protein